MLCLSSPSTQRRKEKPHHRPQISCDQGGHDLFDLASLSVLGQNSLSSNLSPTPRDPLFYSFISLSSPNSVTHHLFLQTYLKTFFCTGQKQPPGSFTGTVSFGQTGTWGNFKERMLRNSVHFFSALPLNGSSVPLSILCIPFTFFSLPLLSTPSTPRCHTSGVCQRGFRKCQSDVRSVWVFSSSPFFWTLSE